MFIRLTPFTPRTPARLDAARSRASTRLSPDDVAELDGLRGWIGHARACTRGWEIRRNGRLVGAVALLLAQEREADLGYLVLPPWQGRGVASAAVVAALGRLRLGARRSTVQTLTIARRDISARILVRCGFRRRETLRWLEAAGVAGAGPTAASGWRWTLRFPQRRTASARPLGPRVDHGVQAARPAGPRPSRRSG